ncbi:MAG: molecular chaperone Hsc20 [Chitinophagaceae bacterium BSSC1]|nr:MAG: molecular chaperone Hsc20 [Chitinophagaceae bacterium BSSC1]
MNYFELFDIEQRFLPDQALVKKKFYLLSRQYHPDFYGNGSDEEKEKALEMSALVNKAYQTLQNQDLLVKYVLKEAGLLEEDEKYQLSPDFLMEVMDLNEQLMDADEPETKSAIKTAIDLLNTQIYEPVKATLENHPGNTLTQEKLLQVKEFYFRKKYLDRILAEL